MCVWRTGGVRRSEEVEERTSEEEEEDRVPRKRDGERDSEHEGVRQIEIQKRKRWAQKRRKVGGGGWGASAYRGSLWSSKKQQQ